MKTTIEINDGLLRRAKAYGQSEGLTLRTLVEQGLQQVLGVAEGRAPPTRIESIVFDGPLGLTEGFADMSWGRIKDESRRR